MDRQQHDPSASAGPGSLTGNISGGVPRDLGELLRTDKTRNRGHGLAQRNRGPDFAIGNCRGKGLTAARSSCASDRAGARRAPPNASGPGAPLQTRRPPALRGSAGVGLDGQPAELGPGQAEGPDVAVRVAGRRGGRELDDPAVQATSLRLVRVPVHPPRERGADGQRADSPEVLTGVGLEATADGDVLLGLSLGVSARDRGYRSRADPAGVGLDAVDRACKRRLRGGLVVDCDGCR
jgi:hypothetical protein